MLDKTTGSPEALSKVPKTEIEYIIRKVIPNNMQNKVRISILKTKWMMMTWIFRMKWNTQPTMRLRRLLIARRGKTTWPIKTETCIIKK